MYHSKIPRSISKTKTKVNFRSTDRILQSFSKDLTATLVRVVWKPSLKFKGVFARRIQASLMQCRYAIAAGVANPSITCSAQKTDLLEAGFCRSPIKGDFLFAEIVIVMG